jgi:ABC-type siderophore export system fused ATPase/permease subunit
MHSINQSINHSTKKPFNNVTKQDSKHTKKNITNKQIFIQYLKIVHQVIIYVLVYFSFKIILCYLTMSDIIQRSCLLRKRCTYLGKTLCQVIQVLKKYQITNIITTRICKWNILDQNNFDVNIHLLFKASYLYNQSHLNFRN